MSLVRKFLLIFMILGAVVAFNIVVGVWTLRTLQREFAGPLNDVQRTMVTLHALKREVEGVGEALRDAGGEAPMAGTRRFGRDDAASHEPPAPLPPSNASANRQHISTQLDRVKRALERLVSTDALPLRAGASTPRNLSERVGAADAAARRWLDQGRAIDAREASEALFGIHEFIERIEGRVLEVAADETTFQKRLGRLVWWVLAASLSGMILAILLATQLVRRWVMQPVADLRDAAGEHARGNFAHRTRVRSQDELGQLAGEVNHMAGVITSMQEERIARERLAAMGEMVRRLVHNLRNPLAGIRSLAELTQQDLSTSDARQQPLRENQERIVRTIDGFERWLKDLLETTRPLELRVQAVTLGPWLRTMLEPLELLAQSRNVRLELDVARAPETAAFDRTHLDQALVGIVTNAVQASPEGGVVRVVAHVDSGNPSWSIEISDQGPGVPESIRDKVFLPHFTTKPGGTGTGLAVAKQVVEQHGGRILVENGSKSGEMTPNFGPGAIFLIRLPLRATSSLATIGQEETIRPTSESSLGQHPRH